MATARRWGSFRAGHGYNAHRCAGAGRLDHDQTTAPALRGQPPAGGRRPVARGRWRPASFSASTTRESLTCRGRCERGGGAHHRVRHVRADGHGSRVCDPSTTQSATITFTAYRTPGIRWEARLHARAAGAFGADIGPLLGLTSFTGRMKITSTYIPSSVCRLTMKRRPMFSSLPPGDLPSTTQSS